MNVKFTGVEDVERGLMQVSSALEGELPDKLQMAAELTAAIMREEAPKRTGSLRDSITITVQGMGDEVQRAEIGPDDSASFGGRDVGGTVEAGRTAGRTPPPWFSLYMRYGLTVAQAKRAAKTIGDQGTIGNPFVARTFMRVAPRFFDYGIQATYNATNRF